MISICIKSANTSKLNWIDNSIGQLSLSNIYYTKKRFKNYNNLIIHFKGKNSSKFYDELSEILSEFTIDKFESSIIHTQLKFDYFYFNTTEKKSILQSTLEKLNTYFYKNEKKEILKNTYKTHFKQSKILYLDGFINFRLYDYKNLITTILEETINDYVLQKEYAEYVDLLYEYIHLQPTQSETVHLIYNQNTKLLLDQNSNIITNVDNAQVYLSDISFSSNDFILNTLLTLLPQTLYIHSNDIDDNFLKFLKLIFNDRFFICNNCQLCSNYLISKQHK